MNDQIQKEKLGRKFMLTENQQAELFARVFRLADIGMPIADTLLRRSIFTCTEKMSLEQNFSQETKMVGRKWLPAFFRTKTLVANRKSQNLNPRRFLKLNRIIASDNFQKLQSCFEELDIVNPPQHICNMDDKGFRNIIHY